MFHRMVLKVTNFQHPTLKHFSTVHGPKHFWGRGEGDYHPMSNRVRVSIESFVSHWTDEIRGACVNHFECNSNQMLTYHNSATAGLSF